MRIHKGLKLVFLFQLVACGQAFLLLLLIKHHLFNNTASFVIQVAQLAILWLNLLGIDLLVTLKNAVPPVLTLLLGEVELQNFAVLTVSFDAPRRLLYLDGLVEFALDDSSTVLYLYRKLLCSDYDIKHLACCAIR